MKPSRMLLAAARAIADLVDPSAPGTPLGAALPHGQGSVNAAEGHWPVPGTRCLMREGWPALTRTAVYSER